MLAYHLFGWDLPNAEVLFPVIVGTVVGLLCLFCVRLLSARRSSALAPPRSKGKPGEYDPFVMGSPTEQRRSYRRTGNPVQVFFTPQGTCQEPKQGWVYDRSMGGLGLVIPYEVAPGTVLQIMPVNAPSVTPWIDVEVRSCRPAKDVKEGWEVGCQFVKTPQWGVLLLFG